MSEENNETSSEISFSDTVKTTSVTKKSSKSSGDEGKFSGFCPTGHPCKHVPIHNGLKTCPTCNREF